MGNLNSISGRGTAGGLITISPIVGKKVVGTITAVLTAAHVAYEWLPEMYKHEDKRHLISSFSSSCLFATYSREEKKPYLDYAIVPINEKFQRECDIIASKDHPILNGKRFGSLTDAKMAWECASGGSTVHKRGIATHETEGILAASTESQGQSLVIENKGCSFAGPGDSGAITFLEVDDLLYPIGLHYSSDSTGSHFSIPLRSILRDYCEKHCLDGLNLTFENPKLSGTLRYDAHCHTEALRQDSGAELGEKGNPTTLSVPKAVDSAFGFEEGDKEDEEEGVRGLLDGKK